MKSKNRHISTEKKLFIGLIIALIVLACLLYFYHSQWVGLYVVDNVPTSFVGVGIIVIMSLTICTVFLLGAILLGRCLPDKSTNKE